MRIYPSETPNKTSLFKIGCVPKDIEIIKELLYIYIYLIMGLS